MIKEINNKVETVSNAKKLTNSISLLASLTILLFAGICYWLLDIKKEIPIIFLCFSILNTLIFVHFKMYRNIKTAYFFTSILIFISTYLISLLSGGVKSSFIYFIPIIVISGYSMNKKYGNLWLLISFLSFFSLYFIDNNYIENINCVSDASHSFFSFFSLLLSTAILGGVFGRYLSNTIYTSIKNTVEIEKKNTEKELLLKEIHHRVKNNLQVITSLLNLQSSFIENIKTKELFRHSQYRINSMAMIHEMLYQTKSFGQIHYHDYLLKLISNLINSIKGKDNNIELKLNARDVNLNIDTSIPLGLLINEIITNSLKYGIKNNNKGVLSIVLKEISIGHYLLEIGDNGIGFPNNIDSNNSQSLGLRLINNLILQLKGNIKKDLSKKGTNYIIHFQEIKQLTH